MRLKSGQFPHIESLDYQKTKRKGAISSALFRSNMNQRLPLWFLAADNADLNALATVRAGEVEGDKLIHHALGDGGNHRIDVVQTLVQHIYLLLEALNLL